MNVVSKAPADNDADRELAARARRGDRDALGDLYERHKGRLLGFLRRLVGTGGIAEDVFQDTWMKAMRSLRQYDPRRGTFQSWLYRVATNAGIDRLRLEGRGRWLEEESGSRAILDRTPAAGPDPELRAVVMESERDLQRALGQIDPRQRCAILLRHQIGLTYAEIASTLRVAEGTAKTLVHRGIIAVRKRLEESS